MRMVSWNCRGVGGPPAVRSLCDVVKSYKPSIVGLIETKKEDGDWDGLRSKLGFAGSLTVNSRGKSGGLALMWVEGVEVDLISLSYYHIDVRIRYESEFFLTLFYGNPRVQNRRGSWELLRHLKKGEGEPWIVIGDFNEVAHSWEVQGRRDRSLRQMREFNKCLEDCGLTDLGYRGEPFTYSNRRKGDKEVKGRLDRAVANGGWRETFPKAAVHHGVSYTSDHSPIVVHLEEIQRNNNGSFRRFEPMWLRHGNFKRVLEAFWNSQSTSTTMSQKLKIQYLKRLPRTDDVAREEAKLIEELDEWLEREELWWRQRSRAEWLKHGDRNTAYFHARASQRRKRNYIGNIKNMEGTFCSSAEEMYATITNYFSNIFCSQVEDISDKWCHESRIIPKVVTEDMNRALVAPFTEGEVRRALYLMHPSKAPGLDGLSAAFYQSNWEIVGTDVVKEVLNCLNNKRLDPDLNETLIVLIPKVKKVEKVEELRPISLCSVAMKIITKVLANRLKEILPELIFYSPSAFVKGRLISDNILIAHEISHYIKCRDQQKTGHMSLKLDMSKAYDRIEWCFLEKMMLSLGFDRSWVDKVMLCVQTVSYRVRINDQISEKIYPSRGLRQGDPMSPYLFILCAEWLNYAVCEYQEMGLLKGVRLCRGAPEITHLMFADDCMFFLKAEKDSVKWIRDILRRYEGISGQKVNYAKSEAVCSKNTSTECIVMLRERMGVPVVGGHSSYLDLPLVFSNKKAEMLRSIEEKMVKRISDWKHKLLSGAGREVLVKSVLQAIPTYAMTCFKLPAGLCRELMRNITRFWWNNGKNRGIHWVRAEEVYKDKENGGLGFRNLDLMNMALLAKQGWRFISSPHLLVSRIYKAKYFRESDIFNASRGNRPSYAWQGIYEALEILKLGTEWDENSRKFTCEILSTVQACVQGTVGTRLELLHNSSAGTLFTEHELNGAVFRQWLKQFITQN
ncbi:unnamed protein product [Rhodiola kirilowii]